VYEAWGKAQTMQQGWMYKLRQERRSVQKAWGKGEVLAMQQRRMHK